MSEFFRAMRGNRFIVGIAILAALGGFLFGFDTGSSAARCRSSARI